MKSAVSAAKDTNSRSSDQSQKRKLTIMVLVLVTVFVFCNLPDGIYWILKSMEIDLGLSFNCFSELTQVLNASVNVIVYSIFGENFRKTFCEMFFGNYFKENKDVYQTEMGTVRRDLGATQASVTSEKFK